MLSTVMKNRDWFVELVQLAKSKGGSLLSPSYVNANTRLEWMCSEGHTWLATPAKVLRGSWCRECVGTKRKSIKDCMEVAQSNGGLCLSDAYSRNSDPLRWKCGRCSNEWMATYANVAKGTWCPRCAGNTLLTLELMQELAHQRGGKCLSKNYTNNHTKVKWQCGGCGHTWFSDPASIRQGKWCPACANLERGSYHKLSIEEMHALAWERGGECLSTKYVNNSTALMWRCGYCKKSWKARPDNIKQGKWCPDCNHGLGERVCRVVMEQLFSRRFPSAWPEWMVNSAGNRMELDGYCPDLKLAFEHQGAQHFRFVRRFHGDPGGFEDQQKRDQEKVALCAAQGVYLIEIPEVLSRLSINDVKPYVIDELLRIEFQPLPPNLTETEISFDGIYVPDSNDQFERIRMKILANGGELLSTNYISNKTPLDVMCKECGLVWKIRPHNILGGKWCPGCSKYRRRYDISDMQKLASQRGGWCLSTQYFGNGIPLQWECQQGHRWEATPAKVNAMGQWCPKCSYILRSIRTRLTIDDMRSIANSRGGACLSLAYTDAHTKLKWQCGTCSHIWEASPTAVKGSASRKGTWCPACVGKR